MSKLLQDTEDNFFTEVNKFEVDWMPSHMYDGMNTRVLIKDFGGCFITKATMIDRLKRKLTRELGEEGDYWCIDYNPQTDEDELYMQDSSTLIVWKLQNSDRVEELFSEAQSHVEK